MVFIRNSYHCNYQLSPEVNNKMPPLNDEEIRGLEGIRSLTEEFLKTNTKDTVVKKFLKDVDEEFMLLFLRGRKHRPKYAWETLKRYAEVKLVKYPEMFPEDLPSPVASLLQETPIVYVLKHRDSQGRRIMVFDMARWDTKDHSLHEIAMSMIPILENLIRDEDCMKNGLVIVHESSALGIKHCLQYSVPTIRQLLTIFWHSYPVRYKAVYFVNTPYMLSCAMSVARFLFPKKLKERLFIWAADRGYKDLHKILPPDILPRSAGGTLEPDDAIDREMLV